MQERQLEKGVGGGPRGSSGGRSRCGQAACLALLLTGAALAGPPRFDLEVGVPPGSPLEWGRAFPALTPGRGPLFPVTPMPGAEPKSDGRTRARPRTIDMDLRLGSSFGLVRILTWDLTAHLDWLRNARPRPPLSGELSGIASPPQPGEPLYWITLSPLLRLMLHPGAVSRHATVAHLLEIGEPAMAALPAARREANLRSTCDEISRHIGDVDRRPRSVLPARNPRDTMLSRFVLQELLSAHPYDPGGGFGLRIFSLAEELEPLVGAYLDHPDSFVARNAAAALGRYETRFAYEKLLHAALTTEDYVVLMRALAALPGKPGAHSAGPLLERLERSHDDVERVALIGAIGRLGADDGVPALLDIGRRNLATDEDVFMAVLTALASIPHTSHTEELEEFLSRAEKATRMNPKGFRPKFGSPSISADAPDPPDRRGLILLQLTLIARVQHGLGANEAGNALMDMVAGRGPSMVGGSPDLGTILPPAQMLAVDSLSVLGERGQELLIAIVKGSANDPSLRGRALAQLPWSQRRGLATELFGNAFEDAELRIHAFEIMTADRHPELVARARRMLTEGRLDGAGGGDALARHLQLLALRALAQRKKLSVGDLLPLLAHPRADRARMEVIRARVRERTHEIAVERAAGVKKAKMRAGIESLLDYVEEQGVTAHLEERERKEVEKQLGKLFEGLRRDDWRPGYLEQVENAVLEYLFGFVAGTQPGVLVPLEAPVPFEQEILFALGRSQDEEAVAGLVEFLGDRDNGYRAHACLALGMAGHFSGAIHLVPLLTDPDPFVRFCAYESLRRLTGQDFFVDWMYGELSQWTGAAQQYARWCREHR